MILGRVRLDRHRTLGNLDAGFSGDVSLVLVAQLDGDFGNVGLGQRRAVLRGRIVRLFLRRSRKLGSQPVERGAVLRVPSEFQIGGVGYDAKT